MKRLIGWSKDCEPSKRRRIRVVEEYRNRNVPRPAVVKPDPVAACGAVGEDGFTYYTCKGECGETKIAALFLPSAIADGSLVCRLCSGEVARRPVQGRPPAAANQRPGAFSVVPYYTRSVPQVFRRGGVSR
jgi:hypothetical protein